MSEEKQEIPRIDMDEEGRWGSPDGEFMYAKEVLPVLDAANKRIEELKAINNALLEALEGIMYFDDEKFPDGHRYGFIEIDLENERLERARVALALAKGGGV